MARALRRHPVRHHRSRSADSGGRAEPRRQLHRRESAGCLGLRRACRRKSAVSRAALAQCARRQRRSDAGFHPEPGARAHGSPGAGGPARVPGGFGDRSTLRIVAAAANDRARRLRLRCPRYSCARASRRGWIPVRACSHPGRRLLVAAADAPP